MYYEFMAVIVSMYQGSWGIDIGFLVLSIGVGRSEVGIVASK